ncbi:hypothetical protein [Paraburkholderia acidisoli]|uniref:Chemotaxis phosphatase CheX-like domain-containing protein n=1 Tax=Paraburkholderia acidisoli TaxID=2571748 RepID=A0A7Z2GL11_9BURK|nr:hypothetical protein [Paraburkholderia acidisoli]QGZ63762.1 hypothetical protein FAZ98_18540 [Paraburkholderia acidisoli]
MIGDHAKDSFQRIFTAAARTRLVAQEGQSCEVVPRASDEPQGENLVILTISSMQFRLIVALHFEDDERTRRYYVGDASRALTECFMEYGNLCCGAMNQQLVEHFPDLGMSTPYALGSACLPYLRELQPDYVQSFSLTLDYDVKLGATLCVCTQTPLDFVVSATMETQDMGGELELF